MVETPISRWSRRGSVTAMPATLTVLALVLAAGISGCKDKEHATIVPQPVQVATVVVNQQQAAWSLVGVVKPRYETDLGFRVAGKIVARMVDVGQRVEAGQPIARLDATDFRLAVESAEAELRAAVSSRQQATADEARYQTLYEKGAFVSKASSDQKKAAADEARSRVDRAERSLAMARNQLAYTELRTDSAGVISALPIEVGQVVAVGQSISRLSRLDAREAVVSVPEQMIDDLRNSMAEVELWGSSSGRLQAHLRELSPQADAASRTYQARFAIDAADESVVLGRTATVHLSRPLATPLASLPLSAVLNDGAGPAVYVVDASGTRVKRTPVKIERFAEEGVLVSAGLRSGDRIVTLGVHMLDDAKPVRVIERRAQAN